MTAQLPKSVNDLFLKRLRLHPSQRQAAEFAGTSITALRRVRLRDKQEVTHKGQVGLTVLTGLPSAVDDLL